MPPRTSCTWDTKLFRSGRGQRGQLRRSPRILFGGTFTDERVGLAEELLFAALEEDPTDEDALCRLMLLLVEWGRRQEALHLYQYSEDVLQQERTEPAVFTRELARRIQLGLVLREGGNGYTAQGTQTAAPAERQVQFDRWRDLHGDASGVKRARLAIIVATDQGGVHRSSTYHYRPFRHRIRRKAVSSGAD